MQQTWECYQCQGSKLWSWSWVVLDPIFEMGAEIKPSTLFDSPFVQRYATLHMPCSQPRGFSKSVLSTLMILLLSYRFTIQVCLRKDNDWVSSQCATKNRLLQLVLSPYSSVPSTNKTIDIF